MGQLAQVGDLLAMYARLYPNKIGARDFQREMTFRAWYVRACRLANAMSGIGLEKGDRVCVLAYNCVEWLEIYAAAGSARRPCCGANQLPFEGLKGPFQNFGPGPSGVETLLG